VMGQSFLCLCKKYLMLLLRVGSRRNAQCTRHNAQRTMLNAQGTRRKA